MPERWVEGEDGVLRCMDSEGKVVAIQKFSEKTRGGQPRDKSGRKFVLDAEGKKLWVPNSVNPDDLPRSRYPMSDVTWDHVCKLIMEGKTLTQIGKMEEFPPGHILWSWLTKNPDYRSQLNEAKRARAEYRADQALAIADDENINEADVPGRRLRKDILTWGAEVDDRQTYGKQTKVVGDSSQPIVFQVTTGVPDPVALVPPALPDLTPVVMPDEGEEHA